MGVCLCVSTCLWNNFLLCLEIGVFALLTVKYEHSCELYIVRQLYNILSYYSIFCCLNIVCVTCFTSSEIWVNWQGLLFLVHPISVLMILMLLCC